MKIKTGDKVRVLAGKDKGKEGKVLQVFPKMNRVVIEGINTAKRHLRGGGRDRKGNEIKGQTISFPAPIHLSNVVLVSPKSGKVGRAGVKFINKDGKQVKVRVLRSKGATEDIE